MSSPLPPLSVTIQAQDLASATLEAFAQKMTATATSTGTFNQQLGYLAQGMDRVTAGVISATSGAGKWEAGLRQIAAAQTQVTTTAAAAGGGEGLGRVTRGLTTMGAAAAGISPHLAHLTEALFAFQAGSTLAFAVVAGLAVIAEAWKALNEEFDKAIEKGTKAADAVASAMAGKGHDQLFRERGDIQEALDQLAKRRDEAAPIGQIVDGRATGKRGLSADEQKSWDDLQLRLLQVNKLLGDLRDNDSLKVFADQIKDLTEKTHGGLLDFSSGGKGSATEQLQNEITMLNAMAASGVLSVSQLEAVHGEIDKVRALLKEGFAADVRQLAEAAKDGPLDGKALTKAADRAKDLQDNLRAVMATMTNPADREALAQTLRQLQGLDFNKGLTTARGNQLLAGSGTTSGDNYGLNAGVEAANALRGATGILAGHGLNAFTKAAKDAKPELTELQKAVLSFGQAWERMASTLLSDGPARALKKMAGDMGKAIGEFYVKEGFAKIAASIFPPNPAQLEAGLLEIAAGTALAALGGAAGGGGGSAGGSGSGSLSAQQQALGTFGQGTLTVQMPANAMLRAGDPGFQQFFAQVAQQAQGRRLILQTR